MGVPISNLNYEILSRSVNARPTNATFSFDQESKPGRVNEPNSVYF